MAAIAMVLWDPVKQFTDALGKPLAMGKLQSSVKLPDPSTDYEPHPTYADSGLTTPNPNPLQLDSAGRATIYLDQVIYKFALFDSLDRLIWTREQVVGSIWPGAVNAMSVRNAMPNTNSFGHQFGAVLNKAATGSHPLFAGVVFATPTIGGGAATVDEVATVYIDGPPTGGRVNYSLLVATGTMRVDGTLQLGQGTVPVGTGAAATLGNVHLAGGAGPETVAQNGWQALQRDDGTTIWIPYWV